MRTTSSSKRFKTFEFDEAETRVEKASGKILARYRNRNSKSDDSPVAKYSFLKCFAQGTPVVARGTKTKQKDSNGILVVDASDDTVEDSRPVFDVTGLSSSSAATHPYHRDSGHSFCGLSCCEASALNRGVTSPGSRQLDITLPQFLSDNEPVTINSDNDDGIELSSSTHSSDFAEDEGPLKEALEHHSGGCFIDPVVFSPDYIIYEDMYCTKSVLTFSCCWIKVEGSAVCGIKGPFSFEWSVGDILNIESQWCGQVETAVVNLHLKSKDTKVAEDTSRSSGIVELNFAVFDPNWSERREAIKSLNVIYKAKWKLISNIDTARSEDGCLRKNNIFFSKHYFSTPGEPFEEVIYPKGDPDAVSISKRDIELLQPETFINDTIIDFYIKYLENKIKAEEKHRFHFFNSFFFRKLANLVKDSSRACEGRAAFQRVRKWTRKVDIFEKDYILIPVNFSLHWSLIVICHPGEAANIEDEDMEKLPKVPCILHMDSIKGSHRGLKNLFQSYLWEEWKERQNQLQEDVSSKFLNLRFVTLELPQQENSFDCGLFLLHYVERFLACAPVGFNPFKVMKFSYFLSKDWFPPAEASLKRAHIKELIYKIIEDNSEKAPPAPCNYDRYPPPELPGSDDRAAGGEFLQDECNSPEICCSNYSSSTVDQEIEIMPLAATPLRGAQYSNKRYSFSTELLETKAAGGLLFYGNYQSFGHMVPLERSKNVMSPIEEGEETRERLAYSPTEKAGGQLLAEVSDFAKEFSSSDQSSFQVVSIDLVDSEDGDSVSGQGVNEEHRPRELLGSNPAEEDKSEIPSTSSDDGLAACVVEDSEEEDGTFDVGECEKSRFRLGKLLSSSNREAYFSTPINVGRAKNIQPESEASELLAAKRRRKMPPHGGRRLVRSFSKDVQEIFHCE